MRARLAVEFDPNPIERIDADLVIVAIFTADRPLRGPAGRVDWRLCGELSRFAAAGRMTGVRDEAILIETGGSLAARYLLALGAGSRANLGPDNYREYSEDAARRSMALGAGRIALALPSADLTTLPARVRAEAVLTAWGGALEIQPRALELRLVLPPEERADLCEALRQAAARAFPAAVELELPPRPDVAGRDSRRAPAADRPFVSHRY